jgi:hypothetical protein
MVLAKDKNKLTIFVVSDFQPKLFYFCYESSEYFITDAISDKRRRNKNLTFCLDFVPLQNTFLDNGRFSVSIFY